MDAARLSAMKVAEEAKPKDVNVTPQRQQVYHSNRSKSRRCGR